MIKVPLKSSYAASHSNFVNGECSWTKVCLRQYLRLSIDGWLNQAYSRLSTTHGHITDCKLLVCMYWTRLVLVRPAARLYSASPLKHHPTGKQWCKTFYRTVFPNIVLHRGTFFVKHQYLTLSPSDYCNVDARIATWSDYFVGCASIRSRMRKRITQTEILNHRWAFYLLFDFFVGLSATHRAYALRVYWFLSFMQHITALDVLG